MPQTYDRIRLCRRLYKFSYNQIGSTRPYPIPVEYVYEVLHCFLSITYNTLPRLSTIQNTIGSIYESSCAEQYDEESILLEDAENE